ncbi:MAG: YabP/YqfC family sporulation protein [Bacilli bacterium]|nr:YabP/YqfC family sporulation protein [Bacilli bacterium]
MILDRIKNYIDPSDLEIHIYKSGIYIINYVCISNFSDKSIKVNTKYKVISISGNKLVISKLKKDELFISGDINSISFNEE